MLFLSYSGSIPLFNTMNVLLRINHIHFHLKAQSRRRFTTGSTSRICTPNYYERGTFLNKEDDDRSSASRKKMHKNIPNIKFSTSSSSASLSSSSYLLSNSNTVPYKSDLMMQTQRQTYHTTALNQKGAVVAMSLGAIALTAKAGQYAVQAYQEYKDSLPDEPAEPEAPPKQEANSESQQHTRKQTQQETKQKRTNIFTEWFGVGVGTKFYEGGFEEKMTRREAALILGVRESSTAKRIKEAHRKILIINHPDTGGSTYITSKVNEAKELLLKGKE